jgi:ferredoxin
MNRVLRVNPIACDAHGVCADLLPEMVTLDPWGYPVIAPGPVPAELDEHARRAVASCPTLALRLEQQRPPRRTPLTRAPPDPRTP